MENMNDLLAKLAQKLGVATEYLWETLIKQQYVNGITDLVMVIVWSLVIVVMVIVLKKVSSFYNTKLETLDNDTKGRNTYFSAYTYERSDIVNSRNTVQVILIFITVIIAMVIISDLLSGVKHLINPDYYAIQEILSILK